MVDDSWSHKNVIMYRQSYGAEGAEGHGEAGMADQSGGRHRTTVQVRVGKRG